MMYLSFAVCWVSSLACVAWLIHTEHPVWAFLVLLCTGLLRFSSKNKDEE